MHRRSFFGRCVAAVAGLFGVTLAAKAEPVSVTRVGKWERTYTHGAASFRGWTPPPEMAIYSADCNVWTVDEHGNEVRIR